jgi:hypothetical protein
MIMRFTSLVMISLAFVAQFQLHACSCERTPTFMEDITAETGIFHAKIVGHRELPVGEIRRFKTSKSYPALNPDAIPPPLLPFEYSSYTILELVRTKEGGIWSDTLFFLNGDGAMCQASLRNAEPGSEYIIKAFEAPENTFGKDLEQHLVEIGALSARLTGRILTSSDCLQWKLKVEGARVIGNITKNKKQELVNTLNLKVAIADKQKERLYRKIANAKVEKMSYFAFWRLLEKKRMKK